jgi:geranylgeranyl diphosphate synthase type I
MRDCLAPSLPAGNPFDVDADVERLRAAIDEVGAVREMERRIEALTDRALAALDGAAIEPAAAARLRDMAIAATRREW